MPTLSAESAPEITIGRAMPGDRDLVVALWKRCGLVVPHNPPEADFDLAIGRPNSDVLVVTSGGDLIGSVMVGHDGHRGWVYYLAVDPGQQRHGYGARLIEASENWLRKRGIRKVQLMVRDTNRGVLDFYERIGYEPASVTVMARWLDTENLPTS